MGALPLAPAKSIYHLQKWLLVCNMFFTYYKNFEEASLYHIQPHLPKRGSSLFMPLLDLPLMVYQ